MQTVSRRRFLVIAGVGLALAPVRRALAATAEIVMRGDALGGDVWFEPQGLLVRPGATVTWQNKDPSNSHTTTAFHPANDGHPLRIPAGATPWNSDYLLPGDTWPVTFTIPGVYDFFCVPHEAAGMVGRIVVARPGDPPPAAPQGDPGLDAEFPSVEEILRLGKVRRPTSQGGSHQMGHQS